MASAMPAPRPHRRLRVLSNRPVASRMGLLSISNVPNLRRSAGSFPAVCEHQTQRLLLCLSLPHCRLGYGSVEQRAEASIQPSEAVILHGQLDTVTCTDTHTLSPGTPAGGRAASVQPGARCDPPMPLYLGGLALSSSCSWVFTYSVGKVMQISIPPAMPPE